MYNSLVGIISTLGRIGMGFITDRINVIYVWMAAMTLKSVSTVTLVASTNHGNIIVMCIIAGVGHAGGILLPHLSLAFLVVMVLLSRKREQDREPLLN